MSASAAPEPIVFLRGQFVPASQAGVHIYDLGIVLGATVTEMTRTFRKQPFRLDEHLARLQRSLKFCRFDIGMSTAELRAATIKVLEHNAALLPADAELGIVHFVTAGENAVYAGAAGGSGKLVPTVCIHTFPLPLSLWRDLFTQGAHVVIPSTRHIPPECIDPKMKNRSRLHWWLADGETHLIDPKAITLLLDLDGNITECAGANILLVRRGEVLSPTTKNILLGISRDVVIELCAELGIPFRECDLQTFDLVNADEVFMSTTPYCIGPVTRVNGIPVADGKIGPVTQRLLQAWSAKVGVDIVRQTMDCPAPA
jgi:branched-chain amino acid aminotransferase